MREYALAAKMIKKELRSAYPSNKFSVYSQSYSMGNSVNVSWDNGPTKEEVRNIVNKYQYGHFDGMTDSYEFSNKRKDIPQAKFVMLHRHSA